MMSVLSLQTGARMAFMRSLIPNIRFGRISNAIVKLQGAWLTVGKCDEAEIEGGCRLADFLFVRASVSSA